MNKGLVIDIKGLTKSFNGRLAVDNINIAIKKGEVVGFLGPNGSGKTTTMRMLCGLLRPDKGQGSCLGYDITKINFQLKNKIGYMTQRFSFYEDLTIRENLDFVARAYNLKDKKKTVEQTINELGLSERQHQLAGYLSGGWKQRLALAASIIHQPELLLLDEPTAGVDPKARREFWDQIHQLAQTGLTVLVSTHYMDEAERCHRIAYILYGKMVDIGSIEEVIGRSGLSTWIIKSSDLAGLAKHVSGMPGVEQVTYFGSSLHVTSSDRRLLKDTMEDLGRSDCLIMESTTSLEDVFIHYMKSKNMN